MQDIIDQETKLKYAHIGVMDCYKNKSFEELDPQLVAKLLCVCLCVHVCSGLSFFRGRLRMEDYQANRLQAGQGRVQVEGLERKAPF